MPKVAPKHPEIEMPNLHGLVRGQFAWRHYYWYLTNEGIQYLREFLHLPAEIVPATFKFCSPKTAEGPRSGGTDGQEYRKAVGAGSQQFECRCGYGRGRGGFGGSAPRDQ
ncbi:unnamed protein product [Candidula unifasciata]|uniref:Plectin/eS10 N-terminal domain-containing protein n=1 Tax=Candidula unifasciata TaxID=100452 RepID=A0A8S3Z206_9EUPU|nr:unnamed protein product [Candidula unifasciata]